MVLPGWSARAAEAAARVHCVCLRCHRTIGFKGAPDGAVTGRVRTLGLCATCARDLCRDTPAGRSRRSCRGAPVVGTQGPQGLDQGKGSRQ